ncbi:MAG: Maf family protein [Spongiibacteraceae bacterium]|jgi:septum formation protein
MADTCARIYLASQSPRRAELLAQVGIGFKRLHVEVDETPLTDEIAVDYVERVAIAKAKAGWQQLEHSGQALLPVLSADTAVVLDGQIMGKPHNHDHALVMLRELSGRTHQVMTAICFCYQGKLWPAVKTTEVTFVHLSEAELERYWCSGEPIGKAGAYAIQGLGALFVEHIAGSYSAVVGLPLLETSRLLNQIEQEITL